MSTPTDANPELLTVVAHMRAREGRQQELRDALIALVEPTGREEGFVNYDLHQGVEDPDLFYLYENWDNAALLDAHLATPHLSEFAARLPDLVDDTGLTITRLRRIA